MSLPEVFSEYNEDLDLIYHLSTEGEDKNRLKIKKEDNTYLYIQTPKLKVKRSYADGDDDVIFEINNNDISEEFYDFISYIDEYNINKMTERSEEWFGQSIPRDAIANEMYKQSWLPPVKRKDQPRIKFTFDRIGADININIRSKSKNLTVNDIQNNREFIAIIKCNGIILESTEAKTEWQVIELYHKPKKVNLTKFSIRQEDNEIDEDYS